MFRTQPLSSLVHPFHKKLKGILFKNDNCFLINLRNVKHLKDIFEIILILHFAFIRLFYKKISDSIGKTGWTMDDDLVDLEYTGKN